MVTAAHESLVELSPAQRQVVIALKRRGEASAEELAEVLGISASGVRQHLAALRVAGVVASRQERGGPGRPTDLYRSIDLVEAMIPKASISLSIELLKHIEEEDPHLVSRIFTRRRHRRVEQAQTQVAGKNLDEKIAYLASMLDEEGYLADFKKLPDGAYRMTLHSCAIWGVASQYAEACATELEFLREVLPETQIERVAHKVAGAFACGYEIRLHAEQSPPANES
jgi:predicted ArsR family transcriptional regulator